MTSSRKGCFNHDDAFCYIFCNICGKYTLKEHRKTISDFVKKAYFGYFGACLGDQNENGVLVVVCKIFIKRLEQRSNLKSGSLKFGVPMVFRNQ